MPPAPGAAAPNASVRDSALQQDAAGRGTGAGQLPPGSALLAHHPHAMPAQPEKSSSMDVDLSKPILKQVGCLGPHYRAWVHSPVRGTPRFFASPTLEALSCTVWWVVPLLWGPLLVIGVAAALWDPWVASDAGGLSAVAAQMAAGVLLWELTEYSLHRWVFHSIPEQPWAIAAHFALHGCHHKFPLDASRLVFPPLPAAIVAAAAYGLLRAVLAKPAAFAVCVGFVGGYLLYDCLHCAMHARGPALSRWRLLARSRRAHMHHHYRDPDAGFGITSDLFDRAFDTRPAAQRGGPRNSQLQQCLQTAT